jgi:hypothetical protein
LRIVLFDVRHLPTQHGCDPVLSQVCRPGIANDVAMYEPAQTTA